MSTSQQRPNGLLDTIRFLLCHLLGCKDDSPPPDRRSSFVPGQILILAEYDPQHTPSSQDIVQFTTTRLIESKVERADEIMLRSERVIVLPGIERTRAAIFGELPTLRQQPRELLSYAHQVHLQIRKDPLVGVPPQQIPGRDTSKGQATLAARQPLAPGITPDDINFQLRAASPNWLASGAQNIIGGGPGARPADAGSVVSTGGTPPWTFTLPPALRSPDSAAEPIQIAILDAVPSMVQLQYAYDTWVGDGAATPPTSEPNQLLTALLRAPSGGPLSVQDQSNTPEVIGPDGCLDVIYTPNLPQTVIEGHQYSMASHGLFIAGIIQSLAPLCKLRLIQVLNDYGGGSLESVANGFAQALAIEPANPLIFNCSFMLHVPRDGDPTPPPDVATTDPQTIADLTQALSDLFAHVNQWPNVAIVAAAGNDGSAGAAAPQARFPAAFEHVTGVASLAEGATPPALASYSDQADDQATEGVAVIGGNLNAALTPPTADAAHGLLGIFIEDIPAPGTPPDTVLLNSNTSGWARWAGTSFATPIVVACAAKLITQGQATSPQAAIDQVRGMATADPATGNWLDVTQG